METDALLLSGRSGECLEKACGRAWERYNRLVRQNGNLRRIAIMKLAASIALLFLASAGIVAPAAAYEPRAQAHAIEKYLNKHLKNRMLVLRTPVAEPARLEFDSRGRPLTEFQRGSRRDDSALLFLRAEVNNGRVELLTERLSLSQLHRSKDGKKLMIWRDRNQMSLLRVVFPLEPEWLASDDFGPGLARTLLSIFLSSQEWTRSLEREILAAM
jgi:hypothetical protein